MKIDPDITEYVRRIHPNSLGQQVAMEQTLQEKRNQGGKLAGRSLFWRADQFPPEVEDLDAAYHSVVPKKPGVEDLLAAMEDDDGQ